MADSRTTVTVLGATGFTARRVIDELCSELGSHADRFPNDFSWAIAARSAQALDEIEASVKEKWAGVHAPLKKVVNIKDEDGLRAVTASTQVILNCTGPYRFLGKPVVDACIATATHYLDLCGEPEFVEKTHLSSHASASAAGVSIIHAAAFDSVPCELGVQDTKERLREKGATPSSVEMFFQIYPGAKGVAINFTTYEAAVHGFGSAKNLGPIRKALAAQYGRPPFVGKRLPPPKPKYGFLLRDLRIRGYLLPYFFADPAIVRLSQTLQPHISPSTASPVQFGAYIVIPRLRYLLLTVLYLSVFSALARYGWGRTLLLRYPGLFTFGLVKRTGPTQEQLDTTTWSETFIASGYSSSNPPSATTAPDVSVTTRISGGEAGYVATPILFVAALQTFLQEKEQIPKGVLTPAVAFERTKLRERLEKDGRVSFAVLKE